MQKKFYKTTFTVEVLSEDSIPTHLSLQDVLENTISGDYVAKHHTHTTKEMNGPEMVNELYEAGSDPYFFRLDDNGNEIG